MMTTMSILAAMLTGALAAPALTHVVHERRDAAPPGWVTSHRLSSNSVLPMRIGLAQSNLENIEDYLMEVSAPDSTKWGQHWTNDEIRDAFAPSVETVKAVRAWLASVGIRASRIDHSGSLGWMRFNATVAEAENLLKTEYHMYEHESGTRQVACKKYHVPEAIQKHIGKLHKH